jgi:MYXO-CTERM domain-containing protein
VTALRTALPARAGLLACALALALAIPRSAAAYCPCYTASSAYNQDNCGVEAAPGTNPSSAEWKAIFNLISQGPSVWGDKGPSVGDIGQGCGVPEPLHSVTARFPCELLKGIAMQETGWRQFCVPDLPNDQVGGASRTIISFDCGYGVGQVTSGMHNGENPAFDRDRVANDATYNLATGTQILASKWKATNCVGDNQPTIIEHWYTAAWAYNGLAYVNNPNNPNYDAGRGVWNPQVGGGAPYQEKVFGWIEHPPYEDWDPTALAYPNPGDIGGGGVPPGLPEPDCASPTDCGGTRAVHATVCSGDPGAGGAGGSGGAGQGGAIAASVGSAGVGGAGSGASSGTSGEGGEGGEGESSSGGGNEVSCACRTAPSSRGKTGGLLAFAFAAITLARRAQTRHAKRAQRRLT